MKKNLFDWILYSIIFFILLTPLMLSLNLHYLFLTHIGISIILGFFGGILNAIRRDLNKKDE